MGDRRFDHPLERLTRLGTATVGELSDEDIVAALAALAATSSSRDAYLANVLATEAMNRVSRARAAIEHVADGILTVDEDGICVAANPATQRILGWSEADLRATDVRTLLKPDDDAPPALEIAGTLQQGVVTRREEHLRRKDGALVHVRTTTAPLVRDGETTGAVIAFHLVDREGPPP